MIGGRLSGQWLARISAAMHRAIIITLALLGGATPAVAQQRPAHPPAKAAPAPPAAPKPIGKFEDWQAATHVEAGQTVCYAFTRATSSVPKLPGRGDVVLTVTQRPSGRDAVAISAGFAFGKAADITVQVEQSALAFYTYGRSGFARDGHAAVALFQKGRQAIARSPGPHTTQVADTFSLRGFAAAYAAINKACPTPQ
jgi:hypothetical protein